MRHALALGNAGIFVSLAGTAVQRGRVGGRRYCFFSCSIVPEIRVFAVASVARLKALL